LEGKSFEQGISDLLKSLFDLVEDYEGTNDQASRIIESMESKITALEQEKEDCQQKLLELTTGVSEEKNETEGKNDDGELERIREQKAELEEQLQTFLGQIRSLKQSVLEQQTKNLQHEEAIRKLGIVGSELESLRTESAKKDKIISGLREKEEQLDTLRSQVASLEEKDRLSKEEQRTLTEKSAQLDRVSSEKQDLEQRLADYQENLDELQTLVSSIPLPESAGVGSNSPFDQLKRRIMSLIPVRVVDEGVSFPKNILSLPILTVPSTLSVKASRNAYFCDFLNALSQLVSKYFDSEQGQALQTQLTQALDQYNELSIPVRTAEVIQKTLLYAAGKMEEPTDELNVDDMNELSEIETLKTIAAEAESIFLEGQPEEVAAQIQSFNKVLNQKDLPSYSVLFLLYLLALRDWVNCIEINSKPLECPQIPPRLQRTVKCN
jgi:hypothetical protein